MKYLKNTLAFSMCLLIALSAATPAYTSFAEEEDTAVSDTATEEETDETVSSEPIESGDFKYTLDEEGKAHILSCSSGDEEFTLPVEIDGHQIAEIDRGAFVYLSAKKIIIPENADYEFTENPFAPCVLLEGFEVDGANKKYAEKDGVLFSKDMKKLLCYPPAGKDKLYTVPEGVEEIGTAAFYENKLEEINLPSSVKTLERHCFSFLTELKKIDLGNTKITNIPPMAFVSSTGLSEVVLPDTLREIEVGAFMDCSGLENIDLPENLESIGQSAFQGAGLTRIKVPASVTYIGYSALGYKDEETPLEFFTVIGETGSAAQVYCTDSDSEYDYENNFSFMSLENYARQLELESMDLQTNGDIMYSVDENGEACLVNCTSMSDVTKIPEEIDGHKISSVYYGAFRSCDSSEIILPDTIKTIGGNAFSPYVISLTLPGNCTEIENIEETFIGCSSLAYINVGEGEGNYSSQNGILYNKDKSVLLAYPQAKEDPTFYIPKTVKEIANSGCCYNSHLEEVDLSSVETIGDYAFEGCTSINKASLSRSLKYVGKNAFLGCASLKSLRVYNKVDTINEYAFGYDYDAELAASIKENAETLAENGETVVMPYSLIEGFTMHVEKDSLAYKYAQDCGIKMIINDTASDNKILFTILGVLGAMVIAVLGIVTGKRISKKKKTAEKK